MNRDERQKPWGDGEEYNRYIVSELASFRKDAWKRQIGKHLNGRKGLKILDAGTGPGFFACILSEEGQQVTGIDYSDGMIACAKDNAKKLGVSADFKKMDLNQLEFEDEEFDVIVTRNVTWTLEYPKQVYNEWKRILKRNGRLLIYDANWHLHFFDEEKLKRVREREERYLHKYGQKEVVAIENMEFFAASPLTSTLRPVWDKQTLENMGMSVQIQDNIGENVYEEWEKDLYGESPLFEICATKC